MTNDANARERLSPVREWDAQLIQIVDAAFADSARRSGPHLACRPGCTQCCHGAFAINTLDALRLRTAMDEMVANEPARAEIIAGRAERYLAEFGPRFPGDRETGILGTTEEEQVAFDGFANEAACPALDPQSGLCELYSARPMACRVFGPPVRMRPTVADGEAADDLPSDTEGLAVCELCFTEATEVEIADAEMIVPYAEEERILAMLDTAQNDSRTEGDFSRGEETIIAYCLTRPRSARPKPA